MIIYGWIKKYIGTKELPLSCNNCNKTRLVLLGHQKACTLFWIPMFPLYKTEIVYCNLCGYECPLEMFERKIVTHKDELKFKTPLWRPFKF
jgi:hypothetical protein